MSGPARRPLLSLVIFRRACRRVESATAAGERALIEIRIRAEEGGPGDRWHLLLGRGRLTATRRPLGEPDSTVVFDAVDFLRLTRQAEDLARPLRWRAGSASTGAFSFAAELPALFRVERPADPG